MGLFETWDQALRPLHQPLDFPAHTRVCTAGSSLRCARVATSEGARLSPLARACAAHRGSTAPISQSQGSYRGKRRARRPCTRQRAAGVVTPVDLYRDQVCRIFTRMGPCYAARTGEVWYQEAITQNVCAEVDLLNSSFTPLHHF